MALLELHSVSKEFSGGIEAVRDVTLAVEEGEFMSILGPSGCGKTTLLRLIAGLSMPTTGELCLSGHRIIGPGADRGLVSQEYTSFPWLSVRDNIAFGLRLDHSQSKTAVCKRVDDLFSMMGLREFADAYPEQLSGGQQQRVALARSLAISPRLLLLDEPFGALDAQTRNDMQQLLHALWIELSQTMLFVTHDIEEAVFLGRSIAISTSRPFRLASHVMSRLPAKRRQSQKMGPDFLATEREITLLLRNARDL